MLPGCYPYKLLVDGVWTLVPGSEMEEYRDGSLVSILIVEEGEGLILTLDEEADVMEISYNM